MVNSLLLCLNKRAHELANEWRVLELVTTCATCHEEPWKAGLVVQRNPVVGHVVQRTDTKQLMWNTEVWQTTSQTKHDALEELH